MKYEKQDRRKLCKDATVSFYLQNKNHLRLPGADFSMSVSTKLLCKVAMPYDGGSVIGLIILLAEVAVPHEIMQPMAYSAPVIAEAKHQRHIRVGYFSFFRPHPKRAGKKKNTARLSKN